MKKNVFLTTVLFAFLSLGIPKIINAQIYCNEVCFYEDLSRKQHGYVVKFDNSNRKIGLNDEYLDNIRRNLAGNENYYENQRWDATYYGICEYAIYEYCSEKSTSTREVYKRAIYEQQKNGWGIPRDNYGNPTPYYLSEYEYVALSKDLSSFIKWKEKAKNVDGNVEQKHYCNRIPKKDLLPKAVNYDFLND